MRDSNDVPPGDKCDTRVKNVIADRSESQKRFLEAYRQRPTVAPAARLAGIHRATVYRWMADTDFADAMRQAAEAFYQDLAATVTAREAARQRWRDERERARRPMRCFHLARARAAKRR